MISQTDALKEALIGIRSNFERIAALHPNDQPHYPNGVRPWGTGDLRHVIETLDHALSALPSEPASVSGMDTLRPEVSAFAQIMEQQLRANDHKPGWKGDSRTIIRDLLEGRAGARNRARDYLATPPADDLVSREEELARALASMVRLYDTDEGTRSLPEYIEAVSALRALPSDQPVVLTHELVPERYAPREDDIGELIHTSGYMDTAPVSEDRDD